ncbi:MAG: class II glutamine amidotransferase [Nitrosotalea sp.]
MATVHYGSSNPHGTGVASWSKKGIKINKAPMDAKNYWLSNNVKIFSKTAIMHVRHMTSGKMCDDDTHPLVNETGDIALAHNGILSDYEKIRDELKKLGHNFKGEVDSEVLLHAYEQWGDEFIKELDNRKCSGWATILILKKNGDLLVYTDSGRMCVSIQEGTMMGFSDNSFLNFRDENLMKNGHLYSIKDGKIIEDKNIGMLGAKIVNNWWDKNRDKRTGYESNYVVREGKMVKDDDDDIDLYSQNDFFFAAVKNKIKETISSQGVWDVPEKVVIENKNEELETIDDSSNSKDKKEVEKITAEETI